MDSIGSSYVTEQKYSILHRVERASYEWKARLANVRDRGGRDSGSPPLFPSTESVARWMYSLPLKVLMHTASDRVYQPAVDSRLLSPLKSLAMKILRN